MKKKSKKATYKKKCKLMLEKVRLRKKISTEGGERSDLVSLQKVEPNTVVAAENHGTLLTDYLSIENTELLSLENVDPSTSAENHSSQLADHLSQEREQNGGEERRIVDIHYYTSSLLNQISKHSPYCGSDGIEFHSEKMYGLSSRITFRCKMCNNKFKVYTCDPKPKNTLDLNTAAVTGSTVAGIGLAQMSELFAAMNLPQMSQNYYDKTHKIVSDKWEETALASIEAAAKREREEVIKEGQVKDGIAVIDVIADGCWGKRTYKKNYSSLSGAAAIVGRRFGEVLFLGVKNKYCSICAQAEKKGLLPKEHSCYKNYTGPSTGMESEIIVEGFKHSIDMHQIIYGRMIGDGDCNTYSKILESRPYKNVTVEKLECKNHLLRNMCNKLAAIASDTKYPIALRKLITTQRILAIRKAICLAIKENRISNINDQTKNIDDLYNDISNSMNHAFGEHKDCKPYYCASEKKNENLVLKLKSTAIWIRLQCIVGVVASNSRSLVYDVNSNRVECFNSVIAKLIGGKRTNLSSRQAYQTRCHAAVVSFNTKKPVYSLQKKILGLSPKCKSKLLEERRIRKNVLNRNRARPKKLVFNKTTVLDKNYGEHCEKPDLDEKEYTQLKETFLRNLNKTEIEIKNIEKATVFQRDSGEWLELRRQLITASNFGKIVKKRDSTSASLVKSMLYKKDLSNVAAIKHGVENEKNALNQLALQLNVKIQPCGLFIDPEIPYLGATPDGVIGEDRVVEIKCPSSAYEINSVKQAVQNKKLPIYKIINNELVLNKQHDWHYQIQGQLHVTRRTSCVFAIWLGESKPLHVEIIKRDDDFFEMKMLPKLSAFYFEHLLPELLDPRHTRNMPLRGLCAPTKRQSNSSTTAAHENKRQKKTNETTCDSAIIIDEISQCKDIQFENF